MSDPSTQPLWTLPEAVGGEDVLREVLRGFYDKLFEDIIVGFFFLPHDKATLIDHQYHYMCAHLGARGHHVYSGRNMRLAHQHLPILGAHFDRRHVILCEVLDAHKIPEHVREAWLGLDLSLRPFIVRTGGVARAKILATQMDGSDE